MSKPSGPRMRKVNSILHEVIAEEVERLKDPRLSFVTITDVVTAPDLRNAVVFFSTLRRGAADEAAVALRAAARRLQAVIGHETRMKFVPKLDFRIDTGITTGERIDQIIRDLAAKREWADDHDESVQRHD